MSNKYLIDTNVLIYYFNGSLADPEIERILKESFLISVITEIEFLAWKNFINLPNDYSKAQEFVSNADVIYIDTEIVKKTVEIRQQNSVKLPDCIIAATAIVKNLIIVTCNVSDFKNVNVSYYVPVLKV